MKRVVMGLCALGAAALAHAGALDNKLELGVGLGVAGYRGDVDNGEYTPAGDLHGCWWFSDRAGLDLTIGVATLRAEEANVGFRTPLSSIAGRIVCLPFHEMAVDPYFTFGLEWASFDPRDSEHADSHPAYRDLREKSDESSLVMPVGLGLRHEIKPNLIVSVEGICHFSETDWLDDLEANWDHDNWLTFTAGLAWTFGKHKDLDSDGDGILDKFDKCPAQPEDKDGYQDEDGCPDPDNDGDGILDVYDKCPSDMEDVDGFQDGDGCPDPDNDGDGVLDVNDKCPSDKEDVDGFQDEDGCPDPDNDGDGILDARDKCPSEPETVNGYQDQDGCPDRKPEVDVEQGKAIVLEGVTFDTGKSTLKAESEVPLSKVLRTLRENQEIQVEIRGYTDNQGDPEQNRTLSQDRADAVKAWLVERGVQAERIKTKGFGPDNPVADNGTPEGRAQNRRIEFFRLK